MTEKKLRETTHLICHSVKQRFFIISSLCTRNDTQIIEIEQICGRLKYLGIQGHDLFKNEKEAINYLTEIGHKVKNKMRVCGIIGYCNIGRTGYLLVISKVRPSVLLHGGNLINTITSCKWIRISLKGYSSPDQIQLKRLKLLREFPIEELHYYCETMDITRPYPSTSHVEDYSPEFCWNQWLAKPFELIGMRLWCVILLQGSAILKTVKTFLSGKQPKKSNRTNQIKICLISRKSNLNPGTLNFSTGLNENGGKHFLFFFHLSFD
ncbi:hypothetical protein M0813_17078 [Anaeramoeba flamelloides]|uniref:SAC domain-containing protein n=1 Tax=Anaeramoeba flamelloides TaxID=1746091 RepID=A0ABQ8YYV0_9EUKA|nr:hypothetical protein M0813_17078 [Anaeramoeba flamelloides]